jgi:hypothetical protein
MDGLVPHRVPVDWERRKEEARTPHRCPACRRTGKTSRQDRYPLQSWHLCRRRWAYIPHIHHTYHIHHIHHHRLYVHYEAQVSVPEFIWISIQVTRLIVLLRSDVCCFLARIFHLCPLCFSRSQLSSARYPPIPSMSQSHSITKKTPSLPFVFSLIHPFVLPSSIPPHLSPLSRYVYITYHRHSYYSPTSGSWISLQYHTNQQHAHCVFFVTIFAILYQLTWMFYPLSMFQPWLTFISLPHVTSTHEYTSTSDVHITFELDHSTLRMLGRLLVKRHHRGS